MNTLTANARQTDFIGACWTYPERKEARHAASVENPTAGRGVVGRDGPVLPRVSVRHGYSRTVLLLHRWAIKLPRLGAGWRPFLWGLLSNMAERDVWHRTRDPGLCPILFSLPGGFGVVMPRATDVGSEAPDYLAGLTGYDHKPSSYGRLNGRVVALDYHGNVGGD